MQTSNTPAAPPATGKPVSGRDAFVADMAALRAAPAPAAPVKSPADDAGVVATPEDEIPVDPIALADGVDGDAEPEAPVVEEAPPPKDEPLDPAAAKLMAAAQKEERRRKEADAANRAAIKAERDKALAEVEQQRTSVAAEAKAAKEFTALQERAKRDPLAAVELLRSLGYGSSEFAAVSHASWAETDKGKADPKFRETAEKIARDREVGGSVAALQKRIDDMEAERKAEKAQATTQTYVSNYLDTAIAIAESGKVTEDDGEGGEVTVATVEAPIFKRWLKSDKAAARQQLHVVAAEMATKAAREHDPEPTHAEVVAEVEKRERIALRKRGIDPAAIATPATPTPQKKPTPPPPGKTLARAGGAPAPAKKKMTEEEIREEFIRGRAAGKFDD